MSGRRAPRRRPTSFRRGGGVALLTVFIGLGTAAPAAAHPYLLSSNPASGSILTAAPTTLDINYTEGLDRPYCSVTLIGPDGHRIATHQVAADGPTELVVAPNQPLSDEGTYAVNWTAVGDDGHTVIGNFGFSVGHPTANSAVQSGETGGSGTSSATGGLQRLLRAILPFGIVVLAGLLLLGRTLSAGARRAATIRWTALAGVVAVEVALAVQEISSRGISAFGSSATGRRLIAELVLTAGAGVAGLIGTSGRRHWVGVAAALGLLVVLADSGHAASQPDSRRTLVLAVYSVHLISVAVWIGAIVTVLLLPETRRSLRRLVGGSLVAVLGTGVATTDWGLRTLGDLQGTTYGKLALALAALFVVTVWLGLLGERSRLAVRAEALFATGALVLAGVLGQASLPLDEPYASQTYASATGVALSVTAVGEDALDIATLSPGIVGNNTLVIEVGEADEADFLHPADGVRAVSATLSCGGCGAPDRQVTLRPTGGGVAWTSDVALPVAASWLVTAAVTSVGGESDVARFAERVSPAVLPHQVVIGVPASLSGATGETCRDQVLGLQAALSDLNTQAADHGDLMRVAAVDLHDGVTAAMARLRDLGATVIALPCGAPSEVDQVITAARDEGLPVVAGSGLAAVEDTDVWSTQPSWTSEGEAIASQALRQGARSVSAIVGDTAVDRAELSGLRKGLADHGVDVRVSRFAATSVAELRRSGSELVTLLGNRGEAAPIVGAFSAAQQTSGWIPSHGILASAQLMSTDFINAAGAITRVGGIEFASDINPFDPVAQYYASRLRVLVPGVRPSFDGLHGYDAGLAIAQALKDGGGHPSSTKLAALFGSHFADFTVGSYQLGWDAAGGTSASLAFFRSTYVNPMAMPSFAPGGSAALAHEGTFLDAGGFEQVAPFRRLS